MNIRPKLLLIILLISLIPVISITAFFMYSFQNILKRSIGENIESLAREKANAISLILQDRVNETEILAAMPQIKDFVRQSNYAYIYGNEVDIYHTISKIDKEWIASKGSCEIVNQILNNDLSVLLKKYQSIDNEKYGEIIVTDIKGATVAMTKTLSDYYQADEAWCANSFNKGRGVVFIDDRGFDVSVGTLVVGIGVPIRDGGEVNGVLKVNYKVQDVLDVVTGSGDNTSYTSLVRSQGSTIASSDDEISMEILSDTERNIMATGSSGWIDGDIHGSQRTIMGMSSVDSDIYTRISSPRERKGISGEEWVPTKWYLVLDVKHSEAFGPINTLRNRVIVLSIIILLVLVAIILVIARSISRPIINLTKATKLIAGGNLEHKLTIKSKDETGQLAKSFNRMTDDLRSSQYELLSARNDWVNTFDSITDMISIVDTDLNLVRCNMALVRKFNLEPEELIGKKCCEIFHNRNEPSRGCLLLRCKKTLEPAREEMEISRISGNFLFTCFPRRDNNGKLKGFVLIVTDITRQKQAEKRIREYSKNLEKANEELRGLDRMKSMFISSMSHELRTPLNSIMGFTSVILDGMSGEISVRQKDQLNRVYNASQRLLIMVKGVIDISNIEAGRVKPFPQEISLHDLIQESVDNQEQNFAGKGVAVEVEVPEDLKIYIDRERLAQCLNNLLSNAAKFTESGTVSISVAEDDGMVTISVSDTGIGIAEEDIARIFMPFVRIDSHLSVKAGGTGLGLYLTKKLVTEILRGRIGVESEEGKGSTFRIKIPRGSDPSLPGNYSNNR